MYGSTGASDEFPPLEYIKASKVISMSWNVHVRDLQRCFVLFFFGKYSLFSF